MLSVQETVIPAASTADRRYGVPLLMALIAAGLAGNYFTLPLFLNINFLFGSIFAMLALQFLGLGRGILAAALIASYTYILWNHPYAIITMTAEVAVVGLLMERRRMGMVLADTLYWLIIGTPLTYLFYHLVMQVPFGNTEMTLTKQAVNGIANTLTARLIFIGYNLRSRSLLISYREIIYNLLAFFVLCPALIILATSARSDFAATDSQIRTQLMQDSRRVSDRLEIWVVNRKSAIVNLAEMAASRSPQEMQPYLEQAKKADLNFKRVGLQDRGAISTAFFPLVDELGQSNIGRNFADRPYIPTLRGTLRPMLSEVVMSKVGPPKPMVAMLAPVVSRGEYGGYVAGILSMEQIRDHLDRSTRENTSLYTLIDKNGNVIMTNRPDQKVMAPFVRGKGTVNRLDGRGILQWVPDVPPNTPISERWRRSFYIAESTIGDLAEWKLVLEQPMAPFQEQLYDNYTGKLTLLFLLLLGGLALAELLSRRTVATLEQLRQITRDLPARLETNCTAIDWPESGVVETNHLINNFRETADSLSALVNEIRRLNESLEQRVETRTQQVAQLANEQRIILGTMPIGACFLRERQVEWASPAFDRILGYDAGETLGLHASAFFQDDGTYERLGAAGYAALGHGSIFTADTELLRKDGSLTWCSIAGQAVNASCPEDGAIWMIQDITERKALEQELVLQRESYRTVADFTYDWEYWIKPDGTVFYCSPACERITGYRPEEITHRPALLLEIVHPDDQQIIRRHLEEYLTDSSDPYEQEFRIINRSGETRWISHVCQAVFSGDGSYQGRRSSNRDVTEKRLLREEMLQLNAQLETRVRERTAELERLNKELEGFCYSISHELRAPLARLKGFCGLITESVRHSDSDGVIHCSERIEAASDRLRTVIDALLALNRLARTEIQPALIDLSGMATQIVAELLEQHKKRSIQVTVSPGIMVRGDRHLLEICMRNLLENAVKYTARTPEAAIEMGTVHSERGETYFVRDNGVGFEMEHARNLFVPFCRLHSEPEFEGSGVGLATVQRIIERHRGHIWAQAVPGRGATFYFTLGIV